MAKDAGPDESLRNSLNLFHRTLEALACERRFIFLPGKLGAVSTCGDRADYADGVGFPVIHLRLQLAVKQRYAK